MVARSLISFSKVAAADSSDCSRKPPVSPARTRFTISGGKTSACLAMASESDAPASRSPRMRWCPLSARSPARVAPRREALAGAGGDRRAAPAEQALQALDVVRLVDGRLLRHRAALDQVGEVLVHGAHAERAAGLHHR